MLSATNTVDTITNAIGGGDYSPAPLTWREKYGESLTSDKDRRLQQYRDMQVGQIQAATQDRFVQVERANNGLDTGSNDRLNTGAVRNVAQSFTPAQGTQLRAMGRLYA